MTESVFETSWSTRLAAGSGVVVSLLGLLVLFGWASGSGAMIQVLPSLPPMTRNTALCFTLIGIALSTLAFTGPRWLVRGCAGAVAVLSTLTVVQRALNLNIGIDEFLGASYISTGLVFRGRMAPGTAVCFATAAMSLAMSPQRVSSRSAMVLGLNGSVVTAFGVAAIAGFWGAVNLAALHTALGLWLLGFGMLALAWRVDAEPAPTPPWLPISVSVTVLAATLGLWRALFLGGYAAFALLPTVVLIVGCVLAPIFALTVYLAQRGHAQAAALQRSQAFLAHAQNVSRTGSFAWRVATNEITLSDEVYRLFELENERPVTLATINERVHPDDIAPLYEVIARAQLDGRDFEYEHRMVMRDRSIKYLHMVAQAGRNKDGGLEYIGAIQDVTGRRVSEEALGRARTELTRVARATTLGALAASIAHEVSQPLSGMVSNANTCLKMLVAEPPNVEGARETVRRTIRDGDRATDVIVRLRAMFRKEELTKHAVDINDSINEVLVLSRSELRRSGVAVRTEFAAGLPQVAGDRVQLQQVMMNLLLNALEAMSDVHDRPRQVFVATVLADDGQVCLSVRDSGVGLDSQFVEKLFEAFYTTKDAGMGIGLSVSRSIIDHHGGRLWAMPNAGPGATFAFSVPAASRG
jgi:signal transduction histidine kinase